MSLQPVKAYSAMVGVQTKTVGKLNNRTKGFLLSQDSKGKLPLFLTVIIAFQAKAFLPMVECLAFESTVNFFVETEKRNN